MHRISRWKKKPNTGRHLFIVDGVRKTILPGDFVTTTEQALGNQVKHYERVVSAAHEEKVVEVKPVQMKKLQLVRVSRGLYNVINPDNPKKPLNDEPLKKADVELFAKAEPITEMGWDDLVALMEERGIELLPEYETEDDLRQAIINASK